MATPQFLLSEYGCRSRTPSPVNRMMSSFAADFREGVDINLGVGYVNENTIPRSLIREALGEVLSHPKRYKSPLNYGGPQGSPTFLESLRRFHVSRRIGGLTEEALRRREFIVGPNGATSILEGLAHVLRPGVVITSDPMYYIYCDYLERQGFEVATIPERRDGLHAEDVEAWLSRTGRAAEVSFLYVVTVNNPSATILSNRERTALVRLAARLSREQGRIVPLILDKAYEDLIHDPSVERPRSGLLDDEDGVVFEVGTVSKILAPSLRIGYLVGSDGPFLQAMIQRTSDAGFSAPLINQEIAGWLLDNALDQQLSDVNRGYREKALAVRGWLEEKLGPAIAECRGGQASFYFYLTLNGVKTGEGSPFFRFLARTTGDARRDGAEGKLPRVIYIPGEFCVHPRGDMVEPGARQLRFSYGYEELGRMQDAVGYMAEAVQYARGR
ncbi:MAG TPA: pyridoxal phosphate-dependent aminotransferase [Spirochaetia bacterium]|nr:pyridoxal phosphate-dependent aminotransferase [Spirochaetia bacterium]